MKAIKSPLFEHFCSGLNRSLTQRAIFFFTLLLAVTKIGQSQSETNDLQLIEQLKNGTLVVLLNTEPNKVKYFNAQIANLRNSTDPKAAQKKAGFERMLAQTLEQQGVKHRKIIEAFQAAYTFNDDVIFVYDSDWRAAKEIKSTVKCIELKDSELSERKIDFPEAAFVFKEGQTKSQQAKEGFILLDPNGEFVPKPMPYLISTSFSGLFKLKNAELRVVKKLNAQLFKAHKRIKKNAANDSE